jgi:hypothetical protein
VTGRTLHDALLGVLTSGALRARAAAGDVAALGVRVGAAEAAVLCTTDPARLRGLARFLGRHFYRERIVRLFAAGRRLARDAGQDPLRALDSAHFAALLDEAELGSGASADRVAALVEGELSGVLAGRPWGPALLAYEGTLFRVEAGPRRWRARPRSGAAVRAATARLLTQDWDVTPLVAAVRRNVRALPEPSAGPVRLLVALGPDGRVTAARCADGVARLLAALDVPRTAAELAVRLEAPEAQVAGAVTRLAALGAVEWCEPGAGGGGAAGAGG